MAPTKGLVPHPLPKHCWPARQKDKLDKPGATDSFLATSKLLCQQMQASVPEQDRTKIFHHLTEAIQSVCDNREFVNNLSVFRDLKAADTPGHSITTSRSASKPRHRACAVGYNPIGLTRSQGLFPLDTPAPNVEEMRLRRHDAILDSSFLLVGDAASRAFRGSEIPRILESSLLAMGAENFDMIEPQKAFESSSFNHMGCPLGLLSHLTFIYQCEIRSDGKITLNVIWTKLLEGEDKHSFGQVEDKSSRLQYCKAAIDSFNATDPRQAAKLFAWFHSIGQWSLKERLEALKLAQQLDEVRQRRFQHANISLLQEFGADLSTTWLSEQILKSIPGPALLEPPESRIAPSPVSARSKSLRSRSKKERMSVPRPQPRAPTPPPTMAWKGLLPAHKLAGFPKEKGLGPNYSAQTSPEAGSETATVIRLPQGKALSGDNSVSEKNGEKQKELAQRLLLMTTIYDAILKSPERGKLVADMLLNKVPMTVG